MDCTRCGLCETIKSSPSSTSFKNLFVQTFFCATEDSAFVVCAFAGWNETTIGHNLKACGYPSQYEILFVVVQQNAFPTLEALSKFIVSKKVINWTETSARNGRHKSVADNRNLAII